MSAWFPALPPAALRHAATNAAQQYARVSAAARRKALDTYGLDARMFNYPLQPDKRGA